MPTRRQMEMTVIVVVLLTPVLSMVHLWLRKNLAVNGSGPLAEAAAVGTELL